MLSLLLAASAAPVLRAAPTVPQQWKAHVEQSSFGTMPIPPEIANVSFQYSYDYANRREKYLHVGGKHAGEYVVYRWDKKQPGEPWSQAYAWTPGKEALCCYINLCNGQCSISTAENMHKLEVNKKATDMGPSGAHGEHWFADMSIKILSIGNVNDWIVDTTLDMAITNWTSNASAPHMGWEKQTNIYTDITLGNLTEADFTYPKFCNENMCEAEYADSLRIIDGRRRKAMTKVLLDAK